MTQPAGFWHWDLVYITPDLADDWLAKNYAYYPDDMPELEHPRFMKEYALDMANGEWDTPGPDPGDQEITRVEIDCMFSSAGPPALNMFLAGGDHVYEAGTILDGIHRLNAVIFSGVSIWAWVQTYSKLAS